MALCLFLFHTVVALMAVTPISADVDRCDPAAVGDDGACSSWSPRRHVGARLRPERASGPRERGADVARLRHVDGTHRDVVAAEHVRRPSRGTRRRPPHRERPTLPPSCPERGATDVMPVRPPGPGTTRHTGGTRRRRPPGVDKRDVDLLPPSLQRPSRGHRHPRLWPRARDSAPSQRSPRAPT